MISRTSAIPLHTQFRAHLLQRIERGELRQGQKLPSEREYADQLGVSLAPIRQAILDLAKEGYLHRTRGRGTFVQEAKVDEKIAILSSFTQSMRAKGLEQTKYSVLSRGLAGTRNKTVIVNLPGSPRGAVTSFKAIEHLVPHIVDLLSGRTEHTEQSNNGLAQPETAVDRHTS